MISKQVGEMIQEKMKDTSKMVEEEEKKNPSTEGQIKREIDVTKLPGAPFKPLFGLSGENFSRDSTGQGLDLSPFSLRGYPQIPL